MPFTLLPGISSGSFIIIIIIFSLFGEVLPSLHVFSSRMRGRARFCRVFHKAFLHSCLNCSVWDF